MESERFDWLVRQAASGTSRRGALRLGIGSVAASALAMLGRGNDAEGRRQQKQGRKRRLICFQGETLVVRRRKRFFKQGATRGACPVTPPETCPANVPITCGEGCCPTQYPKCCTARLGENLNNPIEKAAILSTCNPQSFNCCPVEQGGGSCGGSAPQCCPPTKREPFGTCAPPDHACCPATQGGGACPSEYPVCCPGNPNILNRASRAIGSNFCCSEGESCCDADGKCPVGYFCSGGPGGCCVDEDGIFRAAGSRRSVSDRFHLPVQ